MKITFIFYFIFKIVDGTGGTTKDKIKIKIKIQKLVGQTMLLLIQLMILRLGDEISFLFIIFLF